MPKHCTHGSQGQPLATCDICTDEEIQMFRASAEATASYSVERKVVTTSKLNIGGDELVEMIRKRYPLLTRDAKITIWVEGVNYGGDINITDGDAPLQVVVIHEEIERT